MSWIDDADAWDWRQVPVSRIPGYATVFQGRQSCHGTILLSICLQHWHIPGRPQKSNACRSHQSQVAVALQVSGYTKVVVHTNPECPVRCNEEMAVAADQGMARLISEWRRTHSYGCETACNQSINDQDIHSIQKEQGHVAHNIAGTERMRHFDFPKSGQ